MKNFAAITANYISRPFVDHSCMGLLYSIYTDLGVNVPDTFEDLTLDNYMEAFKADPRGTQIRMLRFARSLGRLSSAVNPHLADLLVVTQKGRILFPAIYAGRGQAITSFLRGGVSMFRLDRRNRAIVARRMI